MSRLGVLYALKEDELNKLRSLPQNERYFADGQQLLYCHNPYQKGDVLQ